MKKWMLFAVVAVFIAIPIVFWSQTLTWEAPWGIPYAVGRLLSLVAFVLFFFQYVLSSRIRWIESGIGLDRLFVIHRLSGVVGLVFILIHPALFFVSDVMQGRPFFPHPLKLAGIISLLIIVVAAGSALLYRRLRLKYETWKKIHWATYAILPLAFVHSLFLGSSLQNQVLRAFWLMLAGLYVAILAYRLWNWVQVRRRPFKVAEVMQETHDTWSLHFEGQHLDYKPGQFLMVQLVRDGRVSESHPFTISSSPTEDRLSITVKAVGDFTATIGDTRTSDRAYIDAPYGAFSFLNHDAQNLVFIAGGIGITPFMSMLRYICDKGLNRNVVLIWGNKTDRDIAFKEELDLLVAEITSFKVVHVMSNQDDWPGEKGYVDAAKLERYVGNVENPQIFVCGPPPMMAKVMDDLRSLGVPKQRIHYERFALR